MSFVLIASAKLRKVESKTKKLVPFFAETECFHGLAIKKLAEIMGEKIMLALKRRHLSMQDIADRATVTRLTVSKVEHGDPTVSMGFTKKS